MFLKSKCLPTHNQFVEPGVYSILQSSFITVKNYYYLRIISYQLLRSPRQNNIPGVAILFINKDINTTTPCQLYLKKEDTEEQHHGEKENLKNKDTEEQHR